MKLFTLPSLFLFLAMLLPPLTRAQETTATVYPPHSVAHGLSMGEWGAEMWKWVFKLPKDRNPFVVPMPKVVHAGQSGPVYFLSATGSGVQVHDLEIPEGKDIFLPLLDVMWYNDGDPSSDLPPAEILKWCRDLVDSISVLDCLVDGVAIDPFKHREKYSFFQVLFPENSVNAHVPGEFGPSAHEGYYLMLQAPSLGHHVIWFKGFMGDPDPATAFYWLDATYNITIVPASTIYFRRGDTNGDGVVDISDPVSFLSWLFTGGEAPPCEDIADSQDDGQLDLADAIHTLAFLFLGGEGQPVPGPFACGEDPTPDSLMGCVKICSK
jgi:hypothetical protein